MRILICIGLLFVGATAAAQDEPPTTIEFEQFLDDPAQWHNRHILIEGIVTLEDYGKALFANRESYHDANYARSVPVVMPNALIGVREEFERTNVRIRGVYDHTCGRPEMFCSGHPGQGRLIVLEVWGIGLPEPALNWRRPVYGSQWDTLEVMQHGEGLEAVAGMIFDAIESSDRATLLNHVADADRPVFREELDDPVGRANWLLFTGGRAWSSRLTEREGDLVLLEFSSDPISPRIAIACICFESTCAPRDELRPEPIALANFTDPYLCLPFTQEAGAWWLDAGFLGSMSRIADYGGDLGVVQEIRPDEGNETVASFYTTPRYTGSTFMTRLRFRPRPRVVDAVSAGRWPARVVQMTPDGSIWSIARTDGHLTAEYRETPNTRPIDAHWQP